MILNGRHFSDGHERIYFVKSTDSLRVGELYTYGSGFGSYGLFTSCLAWTAKRTDGLNPLFG